LVESLLAVTAGRTVLWITHRLARMERMDGIVVLDQGRVTTHGTHAELLASSPRYAAWCAQAR
jgi:ABC-type multidrug transport system fused ATPase/permease subunit